VDSGYIYTGIDKQLVKDNRIKIKLADFSFEVFNVDGTKNGEVTRIVPLETNNSVSEDSRKAQFVFQAIKM